MKNTKKTGKKGKERIKEKKKEKKCEKKREEMSENEPDKKVEGIIKNVAINTSDFVLVDCPLWAEMSVRSLFIQLYGYRSIHTHTLFGSYFQWNDIQPRISVEQFKRSHILLPLSSIGRFRSFAPTHFFSIPSS